MQPEETAPYAGLNASTRSSSSTRPGPVTRIRTRHLAEAKADGRKFAMLTAYDQYIAQIFDQAGIEVLLVGDSAANNVMGYQTTLPITLDDMIVFAKSVTAAVQRALVVCDLPFGSYEVSPAQAVESSVRLVKEGGVHVIKMEGGAAYADRVQAVSTAGIPVMAHIGFTPQSEHALGGYRVQGRGDAADALIADAVTLQDAGAFCVLMEMVPAPVAEQIESKLHVPTIGIGAGSATTGQVLVWPDMLGLGTGRTPKFVKKYADLRPLIYDAAVAYGTEVRSGTFPAPEHQYA